MWKLSPHFILLALFAAAFTVPSDAAKILCAFPTPSRAQMVVAAPLFEGLALHGHKVTVLSSFPRETPLKNYRDVTVKVDHMLDGKYHWRRLLWQWRDCHKYNIPYFLIPSPTHLDQMKALTKRAGIADSFLGTYTTMVQTGLEAANVSINAKEFRKIMDTESFDLVIVGIFTNNFLVGKYPKRERQEEVLEVVVCCWKSSRWTANSTRATTKTHTAKDNRLWRWVLLATAACCIEFVYFLSSSRQLG